MRIPRGFALILVLWTVALLSVVAGSFAFAMRTESSLTGNLVSRAQAEALAEGGLRVGIARLLEADEALRWRVDGTVYEVLIDGHGVRIALQSELGRIDLNRAGEPLIEAALAYASAQARAGPEVARQMADTVLDWRDANRHRRLNGAEDTDYAAAGRPYGARDGPFVSVEELTQLLGMTPELFRALSPLVTVHAARTRIDPGLAPRGVLLALPGVTEEQVDSYLNARDAAAQSGTPVALQLITTAGNLLSTPSSPTRAVSGTFVVQAEVRVNGALARRAMVVRAQASRTVRGSRSASRALRAPYSVLAWSDQPLSHLPPALAPVEGETAEGETR